ncbi:hypothetical protein CWI39_0190p0010 [Hamiltosporidium magnivora]|uniref:Uncharacterized protein n=1 Tax=Hamiltosporidium magnivora TaxID=148818 RepID=A0A4Q9LLW0_9MICR|nr:hypothetical protein CWI39_0190p0010 [Hamiltosporidium magnivora]
MARNLREPFENCRYSVTWYERLDDAKDWSSKNAANSEIKESGIGTANLLLCNRKEQF